MGSDVNLLNDYFDEIEYDMEHDNRIGESVKGEYDSEIGIALNVESLNENNFKKIEKLSLDNKPNDIDLKKGKLKDKFEKQSKKSNSNKKKSLLGELKGNIKDDNVNVK